MSQNQLTTITPHHSRGSARSSLMRSQVEARMLRLIASVGRALAGSRYQQARHPAGERGQQHQPSKVDGIAFAVGGNAGNDGAEQNGKERAAFDQRIAGRQLGAGEMVGQDAVFDRRRTANPAFRTEITRRRG